MNDEILKREKIQSKIINDIKVILADCHDRDYKISRFIESDHAFFKFDHLLSKAQSSGMNLKQYTS